MSIIYRNVLYFINYISIVFSTVDNNSLQFKKQSENLKHYEGEHCKFNLRGTAAKLLVYERSVPSGAESIKYNGIAEWGMLFLYFCTPK